MNQPVAVPIKQTKTDFESDQDVRWCPGCGDYSVLATVQRFLPSLQIPREKYVFVSGIGCSSRFPYYMNTYGFHTIHGRAPAVATGIKVSNPDLSVWLITGDGDALSIGGNHFIHLLRRNPDIKVLLFNNRIYGLTKGQYSPTSELGKITKSTPMGSADYPLNPLLLALGAQATFVARSLDVDAAHLSEVLLQATQHRGTALVEIYQNCNIFNDGTFELVREREGRAVNQLKLVHGKPMIYGKNNEKGLRLTGAEVTVVDLDTADPAGIEQAGVTVFDRSNANLAFALARLPAPPEFPVPMGVFYQTLRPTFEEVMGKQVKDARSRANYGSDPNDNLETLFKHGDTWLVS